MATILIVDDEPMICDLLRFVFCAHGHEVFTATSGHEGVELFRQRKPRFTLLDIQMPGMDGIQVLQQIRAIDQEAGVIMLTGEGTGPLEIQARGMGVTDFLRKGLPTEVLIQAMDRAMQRQAGTTDAPPMAPAFEKISSSHRGSESILVVDDDPNIRSMVSRYLTSRGYRVRTASDGPRALAMV